MGGSSPSQLHDGTLDHEQIGQEHISFSFPHRNGIQGLLIWIGLDQGKESISISLQCGVSGIGKCCAQINAQPIADRLSEKRLGIPIDDLFLFFFFKFPCGGFVNATY